MNFRRPGGGDEPEINLVPFIDVLLVVVIFLAVTTTYSRFSELQIDLPSADAAAAKEKPGQINVAVTATGGYVVERTPVTYTSLRALTTELQRAAAGNEDPVIVINADAKATHQAVIRVLNAAQMAGFGRVTFAAESEQR